MSEDEAVNLALVEIDKLITEAVAKVEKEYQRVVIALVQAAGGLVEIPEAVVVRGGTELVSWYDPKRGLHIFKVREPE